MATGSSGPEGAAASPPQLPEQRSSSDRSGCVAAFAATALAYISLGPLFYRHPMAGVAASLALALPVLAWRRPSGWRWAAVPVLAAVGAAVGLWWDTTLGRPPGTSVADNLLWIAERNVAWVLYAALGIGGYALFLLRLVPSRRLRGVAMVTLVPAMIVAVAMVDYARPLHREPLDWDLYRSRMVLRNLHGQQSQYRDEHGTYAERLSELPVDSIVPSHLRGLVVELEEADSTGFAARAFYPRMPVPCTLTVPPQAEGEYESRVVCPERIPYRGLIRWGL